MDIYNVYNGIYNIYIMLYMSHALAQNPFYVSAINEVCQRPSSVWQMTRMLRSAPHVTSVTPRRCCRYWPPPTDRWGEGGGGERGTGLGSEVG